MNEYVIKVRDKLSFVKSIYYSNLALKVCYVKGEDELALVFTNLSDAFHACKLICPCSHEIVVALRTVKLATYQYTELN